MKLNAKQALLAAAQVFEDYPERWTSNAYARDKNGRIVHKQSAAAFCFCGTGIIYRMEYEGLITGKDLININNLCNFNIVDINDSQGRKAIIAAFREAAK